MATRLTTREEYATLLEKYDTFLFDCDGVLWNGDSVVEGVIDVLSLLRSKSTWAGHHNRFFDLSTDLAVAFNHCHLNRCCGI